MMPFSNFLRSISIARSKSEETSKTSPKSTAKSSDSTATNNNEEVPAPKPKKFLFRSSSKPKTPKVVATPPAQVTEDDQSLPRDSSAVSGSEESGQANASLVSESDPEGESGKLEQDLKHLAELQLAQEAVQHLAADPMNPFKSQADSSINKENPAVTAALGILHDVLDMNASHSDEDPSSDSSDSEDPAIPKQVLGNEREANGKASEENQPESTGLLEPFTAVGSFKFDSAENVDEYLQSLGVGHVFRKVQSAANPIMTIYPCPEEDQEGEWAIKVDSVFKTKEVRFKLGVPFEDETFDGRPCQSLATTDGENQLIVEQTCKEGPPVRVVYIREKDACTLDVVLTSGEHMAKLHFLLNTL